MTTRTTDELGRQVLERAGSCCEYCLLPQDLAVIDRSWSLRFLPGSPLPVNAAATALSEIYQPLCLLPFGRCKRRPVIWRSSRSWRRCCTPTGKRNCSKSIGISSSISTDEDVVSAASSLLLSRGISPCYHWHNLAYHLGIGLIPVSLLRCTALKPLLQGCLAFARWFAG